MKKSINVETLGKLYQVFKDKEWKMVEWEQDSLFNRLSNTLKNLNIEEQELFIKLLEKLEYYTVSDYEDLLIEVLVKMHQSVKKNKFTFVPLISNRDQQDVKSGMLVTYLLKSNTIQYNSDISNMKFYLHLNLTDNDVSLINRKEMCLVIIDDFIGSGDSAIEAVSYFITRGVKKDKIIILSLVTLTAGASKIESEGINFFYARKSKNLAEQFESIGDLSKLKEDIVSLSKKIGVKDFQYLGYNESSALLSMIRMPNNTIGVFFDGRNKANIPFPRLP
ncbi:phosphoribosyltransferase [Enterococcus nangangensis]